MAYSTANLVREALAPGSWPPTPPATVPVTNTAADLSDTQLNDAISEADSLIDTYIGGRYATPVAPVPATSLPPHPIDYWSRNIAAYNATLTFRKSQDFTDQDPVARRYAATMLALTAVRDGKAALPLTANTSGANATPGAGTPVNTYGGDLFGPEDFNLTPLDPSWPRRLQTPLDGTWNW